MIPWHTVAGPICSCSWELCRALYILKKRGSYCLFGYAPREEGQWGRMDAVAIHTIDDYLRALKTSFQPAAAGDRSAVLQYEFSGREQGVCHVVIAAGDIQVARGPHPAPTVVVKADFDLWLRIISYDLDGLLAYQDGLYAVEGDYLTLMDADLWFSR